MLNPIISDPDLFTPIKDGVGPVDYMKEASDVRDQADLAELSSKIAHIGAEFQQGLFSPNRWRFREVAMWELLRKQKIRIPIDSRYVGLVSDGKITEEVVYQYLEIWNFNTAVIKVNVRKRSKRWGYGCYVEITFEKR